MPRYAPSTGYDLLTGSGRRLPPKAVFGLAAAEALGFDVLPGHFSAGEGSLCFRILREAGFLVVPKTGTDSPVGRKIRRTVDEDLRWSEGDLRAVRHLARERAPSLAQAARDRFRREHGRLFCEICGVDPVAAAGDDAAEACIEVHHPDPLGGRTGTRTTELRDLMCVCANCHRLIHRRLRRAEPLSEAGWAPVNAYQRNRRRECPADH